MCKDSKVAEASIQVYKKDYYYDLKAPRPLQG